MGKRAGGRLAKKRDVYRAKAGCGQKTKQAMGRRPAKTDTMMRG